MRTKERHVGLPSKHGMMKELRCKTRMMMHGGKYIIHQKVVSFVWQKKTVHIYRNFTWTLYLTFPFPYTTENTIIISYTN